MLIKLITILCCLLPQNMFAKDIIKFEDKLTKIEFIVETVEGSDIPLNKITPLQIRVKNDSKAMVNIRFFDCRMPEHNHGMITKAKLSEKSKELWTVDGFKLHMRGHWEFEIRAEINGKESIFKVPYHF